MRLRYAVAVPDPAGGGAYQYSITLIGAAAHAWPDAKPVVLTVDSSGASTHDELPAGCRIVSLTPPRLRRRLRRAARRVLGDTTASKIASVVTGMRSIRASGRGGLPDASVTNRVAAWLASNGVDLVILPWPEPQVICSTIPHVLAVHDLQHRIQPEFPEVSADGEWEARERIFRVGIGRALLVLVDSDVGREDVLTYYGDVIQPDRVKVLPFLPAPYIRTAISDGNMADVRARHDLPTRYLFFPAQLWSHKNHVRVVQAIGQLRSERGIDVPVVMCGSAEGALREAVLGQVLNEASAAGVADLVRILGYVPDRDMGALYRAGAGVLLPTFFGPTNIPVLEGWTMGLPVLTSDIRGIREQCGDAAVLVNPRSVESIAAGIASLWLDEALRSRLIAAGKRRLESYGPDEYRRRLAEILDEAEVRLRNAGELHD